MNFLLIFLLPYLIESFEYQPQYLPSLPSTSQISPLPQFSLAQPQISPLVATPAQSNHHVQSHYFNNYLQLNDMVLSQHYQSPYMPSSSYIPQYYSSYSPQPQAASLPEYMPKTQRARRRQFKFDESYDSEIDKNSVKSSLKTKECGILKPILKSYVANGRTTPHSKWPWHAQIIIDGNDLDESETYCGGTLISKSFILTAAHCYDDLASNKRAKNTQIILNGLNLPTSMRKSSKKLLKFRAVNVFIHPEYIPAMSDRDAEERGVPPGPRNDLALVEISISDSQVKDLLMPACLPSSGYQLKTGSKCKIMGHGFMNDKDEDNFIMPDELQMADVSLSSNSACRNEVDSESIKSKINSDTICIRGPIHPCVGDSGGPLLCQGASKTSIQGDLSEQDDEDDDSIKKWFLVGVTSFAVSTDENDKCGQFKSAVFGKVAHNIEWINRVTNSLA